MKLIIANDLTIENPSQEVIDYCKTKLTIDNPTYLTAKKLGKYLGNIPPLMKLYIKKGDSLILPFGTLKDIWQLHPSTFELKISPFKGNSLKGNIKLYDYQENALNALKKGKNGILNAPCGSGKTQIGLSLIKAIGGRALWLTHTQKLLEQSKARCELYYEGDFGTITEGEINLGKDITFATVQTMSKIDTNIYKNYFDIVIVDECHHCVGSPTKVMQFYKILSNCNCRYKYGLTATLTRADNLIISLYAIIGPLLYKITSQDVGAKIIKAKYEPIMIKLNYDVQDYVNVDGTLDFTKLINVLSSNYERNKIIIDNVIKQDKTRKQIILCHRVKQAYDLAKMIIDNSHLSVACITGSTSQAKRNMNADVIVSTYSLAKEGLDIPELSILHLATPQKNESTTRQAVGRIERNIENKQEPICYDYVDVNISYCIGCYKVRKRFLKN